MKFTLADEEISISPGISPGPVKNSEHLLRVLHQPEHILDGELIETAISLQDLKSKGFSVDRRAYVNIELLGEKVVEQAKRNPDKRKTSFSSELLCRNLRELIDKDNGKRDFLVVDEIDKNENPVNHAHAAIYSANETGNGGLRKLRTKLLGEINKKITSHEILLQDLSKSRNKNNSLEKIVFIENKQFLILIAVLLLFILGYVLGVLW